MKFVNYNELIEMDAYANKFKRTIPLPHWDYIQMFLRTLRCVEKYSNERSTHGLKRLLGGYYKYKLKNLSIKLGFTIAPGCFGGGLTLYHYGSIVVNETCRAGDFCTLQSDVNISENVCLGDNVYIAPGVKILSDVSIADGVIVGANSVVTKSITEPYTTWVGVPAHKLCDKGYEDRKGEYVNKKNTKNILDKEIG